MVAAWREDAVIGEMLRTALARIAHADFRIYVGVYDGLVYAVNPNGTLRRTWPQAGPCGRRPVSPPGVNLR